MTLTDHLKSRHLDTNLHTVWLDEDDYCAVFPLWNLSGQLVGYQNYRPNGTKVKKNDLEGKYYTHRNKNYVTMWGLESWSLSNVLFVVEGVFDAARLTSLGYSCVALLSNNPDNATREWLWMVKQHRLVVTVCDPGNSGKFMYELGHQNEVCDVDVANDVDLGDAPQWWVDKLVRKYS